MNIEITDKYITKQVIIDALKRANVLTGDIKYGFILPYTRDVSVDVQAFTPCGNNLTGITLNRSNIVYLGDYAFEGCTNLSSMCTSSKYYGKGAFKDCSNLSWMKFNDSYLNVKIDDECFKNCEKLSTIVNIDYIASIGNYAFEGCASFPEKISLQSCTSIGKYAFKGCTNLSSLTAEKCEFVNVNAFEETQLWDADV